ncbi:MAG: KpsF/GutQ family sugar-phosphate isomerase [Leucothrix sp.]
MTNNTTTTAPHNFIKHAKQVISDEIEAIHQLTQTLDQGFTSACEAILHCPGRVIVSGMGKSGHIGNKIAATLASTGTPAFFVHPSEALHGDLGMITPQDMVIAISNSGSTDELLTLCSVVKRQGTHIIAMTGSSDSLLGSLADYHLDIHVDKEACPHNLAPTSSTTATLVMGDALAVTLLKAREFSPEDFARSHPAGRLGKRLTISVRDLMHTDDALPIAYQDDTLEYAILTMTSKQLGATLVVSEQNTLLSMFTDGDLRRAFKAGASLKESTLADVIHHDYFFIDSAALAIEALEVMQDKSIMVLPVLNEQQEPVGIIHMHDLLKAGIV